MAESPVQPGRPSRMSTRGSTQQQGQTTWGSPVVGNDNVDDGDGNTSMVAASKVLQEAEEEMNVYMFCAQCQANTVGECFVHGKVITISDNKLPSRARLSLPSILSLKKVADADGMKGKEGVFAKRAIKPRTQFGPLDAPVLPDGMFVQWHVFDARVMKGNGAVERLDLTKEDSCNWMMFVRPGRYSKETNLAAYQLNDKIYYIASRAITANTELKVWYLQSYGQQFGKEPLPATLPRPSTYQENNNDNNDASPADAMCDYSQDSTASAMAVVGTRTTTLTSLTSSKLTCELCNKTFTSLPKKADHNCSGLNETATSDPSPRTRRKGRPRKMSGTGLETVDTKTAVSEALSSSTSMVTLSLPSVTSLIKTEAQPSSEVAAADSTTVSDPTSQNQPVARRRGRPRGSKNIPSEWQTKKPSGAKVKRPRYNCGHCERSFYSIEQHKVHEAEHLGTKPYVCDYENCGKGFGNKFKWWRHTLVHEQPGNRRCTVCDRTFNRVDHLKNHMATHSSHRHMFSCEKCGKKYLYKATYIFHMALHQAKDGSDLKCSLCPSTFIDRNALVSHVHNMHNRYKPDLARPKNHQCPTCQKTFSTTKDVRRHLVTHTKDRSFLCEFCPQTFARNDHLQRHYKSNHKHEWLEKAALEKGEGETNYHCSVCLKYFTSDKHLRYHMTHDHSNQSVIKTTKRVRAGKGSAPVKQTMVVIQNSLQQPMITASLQPALHQQQQNQLQHLSLLAPSGVGMASHPVQIHVNRHGHQTQPQPDGQNALPNTPFLTTLPVASLGSGQQVEVVADGGGGTVAVCTDQLLSTLKSIPYRFPQGQVLAQPSSAQVLSSSANSLGGMVSQPITAVPGTNTLTVPLTTNSLRQILNYNQPGQQQQQHQHHQQQHHTNTQQVTVSYSQGDVQYPGSSIVCSADGQFEVDTKGQQLMLTQDGSGNIKWIVSNASASDVAQVTDHCYATGTSANDGAMKFSALAPAKSDMETLRVLQSCQVLGADPGTSTFSVQSSSSSGLQANWDSALSLSELANLPLQDLMTPLSQASIVNLPVTVSVSVPVSGDGSSVMSLAQNS